MTEKELTETERIFDFNLIASLTSKERRDLNDYLKLNGYISDTSSKKSMKVYKSENNRPHYIHLINKWTKTGNGYTSPEEYRKVLLQSKVTLCPVGHNPETFRIYEAALSGSIPVLFVGDEYVNKTCKSAFTPFIETDAPFIYVQNKEELLPLFRRIRENENNWVEKQSEEVLVWVNKYLTDFANSFENLLQTRFNQRRHLQ